MDSRMERMAHCREMREHEVLFEFLSSGEQAKIFCTLGQVGSGNGLILCIILNIFAGRAG